MRISSIAQFMQLNGSISGWRDGFRWLRLPDRQTKTIGNVFGYRYIGRGGLRISSTVVSGDALRKRVAGDSHAPTRAAG